MTERLYTTDILRLAMGSAMFPRLAVADVIAERRSPICGSSIILDLNFDPNGCVSEVGMELRACAFGQASAALFAQAAVGKTGRDIEFAKGEVTAWLSDPNAAMPQWPGFDALLPARAKTARHGAIVLPFEAAVEAARQGAA